MTFSDPPTESGLDQSTSALTLQMAPALTILWHPDPSRVGNRFYFPKPGKGKVIGLSRLTPEFTSYCDKPAPLADTFLSHQPLLEISLRGQGFLLRPSPGSPLTLDGSPLVAPVRLSQTHVACAPVLTIGKRIALCLHFAQSPNLRPPAALGLVGNSALMASVRQGILGVAPLSTPVLIRGETGTGKELTAQAIAANGPRAGKPFVAINMAALPDNLAADEIFGHEKGAYTGATVTRDGCFHQADGGTLFLDEIGLARYDVQTALLRVLETRQVRRLGGTTSRWVDVRLLSATDSLTVDRGIQGPGFSQALFHRLSTSDILLPPLRDRREDLGLLMLHFLRRALEQTGDVRKLHTPPHAKRPWLSAQIFPILAAAPWPGNVRQLSNFAMELAIVNRGLDLARVPQPLLDSITSADPAADPPSPTSPHRLPRHATPLRNPRGPGAKPVRARQGRPRP